MDYIFLLFIVLAYYVNAFYFMFQLEATLAVLWTKLNEAFFLWKLIDFIQARFLLVFYILRDL